MGVTTGLYGPRAIRKGVDELNRGFAELDIVMFAGSDDLCPTRWAYKIYLGLCHENYALAFLWDLYHSNMLRCWFDRTPSGDLILTGIMRADWRKI